MRAMMKAFHIEPNRQILWLPVCFGAGALIYLSLTFEPSPYLLVPIAPAAWAAHHAWRRGWAIWRVFMVLFLVVAGFAWMQAYTDWQHVTMLKTEQRITDIEGRIVEISDVPAGYRITLDDVWIDGLDKEQTPERIRVKLRGNGEGLLTGQKIALRAGLLPPTGPVMPGAFDFARYFYFKDIGAVGYAIPPATVLEQSSKKSGFWMWLTRQREALSDRIRSQMSMPEGAVAAALMTGDRAAIPEHVNQVMRDTNLSHILAISGMHMALVTGLLFFSLRYLIVTIPVTRYLRHPKKLAAFIALAAGLVYLFIAGLPISASRAFIMVALVFSAILMDRQVMPMRSLALAAMLLLFFDPSYAMQPGFQLSFAATAALIAWYERIHAAAQRYPDPQQKIKRTAIYLGGVLMTTLVAEIATAPLVLYHFNSVSLYGLLANLIIMPIVTFWIMPFIVLTFLMLPFGLEAWPLQLVEWGIAAMIGVAEWVAGIPGAQFFMTAPPGWGMAIIGLGFAWLIIWRTRQRYYGLLAIAIGLLSIATVQTPDLFVSPDAKQIAGRVDGQVQMLKGRAKSFTPEQWANGIGERILPYDEPTDQWRCDTRGCVYRDQDNIIAFPTSFEAQAQDCGQADLVVTPFYLWDRECSAMVIDKRRRQYGGGFWFWFGDEVRLESTADIQGVRPWSR